MIISRLWKVTSILSVVMLICSSSLAYSQEGSINLTPQQTLEVVALLKACDTSLNNCQSAQNDKDAIIKSQEAQLSQLNDRVSGLEKEASSATNHKLLWFAAGMLLTGVTVYMVKK
jgi:TolA-binding protein